MSLGAGILLSTILLIVVWQIDKRNGWRKAGKALLWALVVLALVGAVAYGYFGWWTDFQARKARAAVIAQVRNPTNLQYWNIGLGMSKAEVRYLKGEPSEVIPADKAQDKSERWLYKFGETPVDYFYDIYWNTAGANVRAIMCRGNETRDCEHLGGVAPGDDEATVRAALGNPDEDNPPNDEGRKILIYGTGSDRVFVFLSRDKVDYLALGRSLGNRRK
jgi:hypothetical protein